MLSPEEIPRFCRLRPSFGLEFGEQPAEPIFAEADVDAGRGDVDPVHEQSDNTRLFVREEFVPERVNIVAAEPLSLPGVGRRHGSTISVEDQAL